MARVGRATAERPLEGRTIVVTRARAQAQRFVELLEAAGARVLQAPTIVIEPPASWEPLDTALAALDSFAWVIFTSVNGVAMVDRRLAARGGAWAAMAKKRVAAIGPATADALAEHGVRPEVVPAEYRAEALVDRLRTVEVPAYQTRRIEDGVVRLREALASGAVDAVTFTSSSTARNFAEQFSDEERRAWRGRVAVASIGPITAATAAEYGLATDVMPGEYTIPALARALADYFARAAWNAGRRPRRSV